jgi:hypothetical protein
VYNEIDEELPRRDAVLVVDCRAARAFRDRLEGRGPRCVCANAVGRRRRGRPALLQKRRTCYEPSTLTARAATSSTVTADKADSKPIKAFARRVRGIVSVGLKAIEFVSET